MVTKSILVGKTESLTAEPFLGGFLVPLIVINIVIIAYELILG